MRVARRPSRKTTESAGCVLRSRTKKKKKKTKKIPAPSRDYYGLCPPNPTPLPERIRIYTRLLQRSFAAQLHQDEARRQSSLTDRAVFLNNRIINEHIPEVPVSKMELIGAPDFWQGDNFR